MAWKNEHLYMGKINTYRVNLPRPAVVISSDSTNFAALLNDGTVYRWETRKPGPLTSSGYRDRDIMLSGAEVTPELVSLPEPIIQIAATRKTKGAVHDVPYYFVLGLSGKVYHWGFQGPSQPEVFELPGRVKLLKSRHATTVMLLEDERLFILDNTTMELKELFYPSGQIKDVVVGLQHVLFLYTNGSVYDFGAEGLLRGSYYDSDNTIEKRFDLVPLPLKAIAVASATNSTAILEDGSIWEWQSKGPDAIAPFRVQINNN